MHDNQSNTPAPPRDRILDAAAAEFAALGFAGARVDAIADRAGVNKAMLYYYIGDKQSLYSAVLLRNFDRISEHLLAVEDDGDRPGDRLARSIEAISAAVEANPNHPPIVLREVASGAVHLSDEVLLRMLEVVGIVRRLLAEGIDSGEFRQTEPILTHLAIVGAVVFLNAFAPLRQRVVDLTSDPALRESTIDIGTFVADLLLNGLTIRSD